MSDLMTIARRFLRPGEGEKGEKVSGGLSPFPPLFPSAEPWDARVAHCLEHEADTLVAASGVSGLHPALCAAAEAVMTAHLSHDMAELRKRIAAFEAIVLSLVPEEEHRERDEIEIPL